MTWKPKKTYSSFDVGRCPHCGADVPIKVRAHICESCGSELDIEEELQVVVHVSKVGI